MAVGSWAKITLYLGPNWKNASILGGGSDSVYAEFWMDQKIRWSDNEFRSTHGGTNAREGM